MKSPAPRHPAAALDPLTELELQVARRADELARAGASTTALKLSCWLQAEQEILDVSLLTRLTRAPQPPPGAFHAATSGGYRELPLALR